MLSIQDFFPDCILPTCPQKGTIHQHILPAQQPIIDSTAKYLFMQGGVGGGKTTGFAAKAVWLSVTIPKNRGIVSRFNLDELYDSTWREILECIDRLVERQKMIPPHYEAKDKGIPTRLIFPNGSEMRAVHGKNWRIALGGSYGWFLVDDAMECVEEFFLGNTEGTTGGLLSRLRLPHVRFDPNTYDETNREHGSLHGMIASNPPPYGHWLHKLFGSKVGIYKLGDDTVEWLQGSTGDNPFTGKHYGTGLISIQQKMGRSEGAVRRIIYGESVPAYKGIPVFPQFKHSLHVAPLKFNASLPLVTSWDFGHDHPAILYSNIYKCKYAGIHFLTLSEVADVFNATIYVLKKEHDKHLKLHYSEAKLIVNCGDRSGYKNTSSNKDARSDMKILMHEFQMGFRYKFTSLVPSLQFVRGLLEPRNPCKCGLQFVLVSNKCSMLIGALEGGYHYSKPRGGGPHADKPYEDKYFADVACAWRYGLENYGRYGLEFPQQSAIARSHLRSIGLIPAYKWMEEPLMPELNGQHTRQ